MTCIPGSRGARGLTIRSTSTHRTARRRRTLAWQNSTCWPTRCTLRTSMPAATSRTSTSSPAGPALSRRTIPRGLQLGLSGRTERQAQRSTINAARASADRVGLLRLQDARRRARQCEVPWAFYAAPWQASDPCGKACGRGAATRTKRPASGAPIRRSSISATVPIGRKTSSRRRRSF